MKRFISLLGIGILVIGALGMAKRPVSGGSLKLVVETSSSSDGLPHWGDVVRFDVSTTATTEPHVTLKCYQNGVVVYGAVTGYYDSYPWPWTQHMTLASQMWTSGEAECVATGEYYTARKIMTFATLNFHVYA